MRRSKKDAVGVFSRAASTYESVGPRHFSYFAHRLVEFCDVRPGDCVLDVATGAGDALLAEAEKAGATGRLVGIDLAKPMLEAAAAAIRDRHLSNIEIRSMDAEELDFTAESFDVVLCSFGFSSFPHQHQALSGFWRVLRPGGRLGLLDSFGWYFQDDARWRWLEEVLRSFGVLIEEDQDDAMALAATVERAHFTGVDATEDAYELAFVDEEECWRWMWSHGTRRILEAVPAARLGELRQRVRPGLLSCRDKSGVMRWTMGAQLVRAQKGFLPCR